MRSGVGAFCEGSRLAWRFLDFFLDELCACAGELEALEDELDCGGTGAAGRAAGGLKPDSEKAAIRAIQCVKLWPLARRIWLLSRKWGIAQEANAEASANEAMETQAVQKQMGDGVVGGAVLGGEGHGVPCPYR